MNINKITQEFLNNAKLLNTNYISNPKLAKRFGVSVDDIIKSKTHARALIAAGESAIIFEQSTKSLREIFPEVYEQAKVTGSETDVKQGIKKTSIKSPKPLSPKEIEELVGVDGINSYIARVWDKSSKNGTEWDYSVDIRNNIKDFYSQDELKGKLKELFPDKITTFNKPNTYKQDNTSLVIYLSDDHLGLLLEEGRYTKLDYLSRLVKVAEGINYGVEYNEIVIVSLGDQLNGWNNETTRGGHKLNSKNNKEQFDDYVSSRKVFYDMIFSSGKANTYSVIEVNNSNHSGLDFSYMANEWLKLYVGNKYPSVSFQNSTDLITRVDLKTKHILFVAHGKDEKHQKTPLPKVLDARAEAYITDYILEQGVNPKVADVSFIKGDTHMYAESEGKSFRYVAAPSIADGSDWQRVNFGSSKAGVLIETFLKGDPEPYRKLVRFN